MAIPESLDEALAETARRDAEHEARRAKDAEGRAAQFAARSKSIAVKQQGFSPTTPPPRSGAMNPNARFLPRELIDPDPNQPRRFFDEASLRELGETLQQEGQLQPIVVRAHPKRSGRFMIVIGERRWRASAPRFGDLEDLDCRIVDLDDRQVLQYAIIENIQRADMKPVEEAHGLQALRDDHGMSIRQMASKLGKSKGWVEKRLDLLRFAPDVRAMAEQRSDTLTAASEIDKVSDQSLRKKLIAQTVEGAPLRKIKAQIKAYESEVSLRRDTSPEETPLQVLAAATTQGTGMSVGGGVSRETKAEAAPQVLAGRYSASDARLIEARRLMLQVLAALENDGTTRMAAKAEAVDILHDL